MELFMIRGRVKTGNGRGNGRANWLYVNRTALLNGRRNADLMVEDEAIQKLSEAVARYPNWVFELVPQQ